MNTAIATGVATAVAGCAPPGSAPELAQVDDQVGFVGQELAIVLRASDPDGESLRYSFDSDVPDIYDRAELGRIPGGAEFRWTPLGADVGEWFFNFRVTDGNFTDTVTVRVEVRSSTGESPIFRQPLGSGTTVDITASSCVELDILVDAPSVSQVQLAEEAPRIEGAELEQTGGLTGTWSWCPSASQLEQSDRYYLALSADDGVNPKTTKHYLIVLQEGADASCPGDPPTIEHTVEDEETIAGLTIAAEIRDDAGLKRAPILYYSEARPPEPPDLGAMNPAEMLLIDGDRRDGLWAADVPNPVAGGGEGERAQVYYVITAQSEAESADKKCRNLAQSPERSSYAMTVTNPGGSGSLGICEPCSADAQCGGGDDLCVRVGGSSDGSCLEGCEPGSCPSGFTCSTDPVTSVEGRSGRQCIPDSGSCGASPSCEDDAFAPNHDLADAAEIDEGAYDLVMCPASQGDDEDWFAIEIEEDSLIGLELRGGNHTDLDLWLYDRFGGVIDRSISFDSEEEIVTCLPPGGYFVEVNEAFVSEENPYTLDYERVAADCADFCDNDVREPDDAPVQAREADIFPDAHEADGMICPGDSDVFAVELFNGETLAVELLFPQRTVLEDLDLRFYDEAENLLTPCSEDNPGPCSEEQGQSETPNEHFEFTVDDPDCAPCTYYLEVWGFSGARNAYEIRLGLQDLNM